MRLAVVVLSYNTRDLLRQALQSVLAPAGPLRQSGVLVAPHWTHTYAKNKKLIEIVKKAR